MSRRRVDAASAFSLRTVFSASERPGEPPPRRAPPVPTAAPPKLSFSLASLGARQKDGSSGTPSVPAQLPQLTNVFARAAPAATAAPSAEAIRLSTVVEDLTQRLRKSADKNMQLENGAARLTQALASARADAATRISALMDEAARLKESERLLRVELKARPSVAEHTATPFVASVRSVLETNELQEKTASAERRVAEMDARAAELASDIEKLHLQRDAAFEGVSGAEGCSVKDLEGLVERAAKANRRLKKFEERREALADEVAKFQALTDSRREDAAKALRTLAVEEAKLDEASANVQAHLKESERLEALVKARAAEADRIRAAMPVVPNVITGDAPPGGRPGDGPDAFATLEMRSVGTTCGLPFHFDIDAPADLGAQPSSVEAPNEMVSAIVNDMKAFFQNAVSLHDTASRGASTSASSAAPLALESA